MSEKTLQQVLDEPVEQEGRAKELIMAAADWSAITSQEERVQAVDMVTMMKSCGKVIERDRDAAVRPVNEVVKRINGKHKSLTGPLTEGAKRLEGLLLAYQKQEEAKAAEEEKRIAEEREAVQLAEAEKLAAEATAKLAEAEKLAAEGRTAEADAMMEDSAKTAADSAEALNDAVDAPAPVVEVQRQTHGNYGGQGFTKKTWTFRITNIEQVPPEYLEVNAVAINAAIRAKVRDIPGLEIYQKETYQAG